MHKLNCKVIFIYWLLIPSLQRYYFYYYEVFNCCSLENLNRLNFGECQPLVVFHYLLTSTTPSWMCLLLKQLGWTQLHYWPSGFLSPTHRRVTLFVVTLWSPFCCYQCVTLFGVTLVLLAECNTVCGHTVNWLLLCCYIATCYYYCFQNSWFWHLFEYIHHRLDCHQNSQHHRHHIAHYDNLPRYHNWHLHPVLYLQIIEPWVLAEFLKRGNWRRIPWRSNWQKY